MNATAEPPTGSTSAESAPKTKLTTIRRIASFSPWFEPAEDLRSAKQEFVAGVLTNVTFNPNANVMKDVFCGTGRISEASVTGELETYQERVPAMPADAVHACSLEYDSVRKVFCDRAQPEVIITQADYLVLLSDGQSIAGWKQ